MTPRQRWRSITCLLPPARPLRHAAHATARARADPTDLPAPTPGAAEREPLKPPPIPDDIAARIDTIAEEFVRTATGDRFAPARRRAIDEMGRLGASEVLASSVAERRLLDRRDARFQANIARDLTSLRAGVEELQRGLVSGRRDARRSGRVRRRIDEVIQALGDGSRALEQDTAVLLQEQHVLWTQVQIIERFSFMARRMDERLSEYLATAPAGDAAIARDDVLLPLRGRRADLALQLAVSLQACAALRIVEQNNRDLIGAIRTATGTTVAALRTSQLVAEALLQRTEAGIGLARAAGKGTANVAASVGAATLQEAWEDVFAAIQRVEVVKQNVVGGWPPDTSDRRQSA